MPRPQRCRKICTYPEYWSFIPEGEETEDTIFLSLDEYEAIRLIDYEGMTHEECSVNMEVARTTVTGIYENARKKLAKVIVEGKQLLISGGRYELSENAYIIPQVIKEKGNDCMRIAVTYENEMVFQHFGHSKQFKIYDVENDDVVNSEVIETEGRGHGSLAGFLGAAQVDTLICGGIGAGAQSALKEVGIDLFACVSGNADEAVDALLQGTLKYEKNATCSHHEHEDGTAQGCHSHGEKGVHRCKHSKYNED